MSHQNGDYEGGIAAIDLFAGPGGWDTAAAQIGIKPLGVEWDEAACATGEAVGHHRLKADIATLDPRAQADRGLDLLIASPPCQSFSTAGKGKGRAGAPVILDGVQMMAAARTPRDRTDVCSTIDGWLDDDRAALVLEPLRWALDLEPTVLAWEQVPAVLPLWQAMADVLRQHGYSVDTGYLTAEQYDVPQTRKRAILVASREHDVTLPAARRRKYKKGVAQHDGDPALLPWISMADALGWGGVIQTDNVTGSGWDGVTRNKYRRETAAPAPTLSTRVDRWAKLGMAQAGATSTMVDPRPLDAPAGTITGKATAAWVYRNGNQPNSAERPIDTPAPTVHFAERQRVVTWEPTGERVTVEEAAVLQGFPADYSWQGTKTAQYRQVGDAVPPPLAWHVLRAALGMAATEYPGVATEREAVA